MLSEIGLRQPTEKLGNRARKATANHLTLSRSPLIHKLLGESVISRFLLSSRANSRRRASITATRSAYWGNASPHARAGQPGLLSRSLMA